jgi:hypothetical protein
MNTKISDAIKRLERACIAGMDEEFRDDVQAVLNHLAADAVPVAYGVRSNSSEWRGPVWLTCYMGRKTEIEQAVMRAAHREGFIGSFDDRMKELGWWIEPVYDHPQPATLNEVSGDSGELPLEEVTLKQVIDGYVALYGSLRQAAELLCIDPAYLSRLAGGSKTNPSDEVLEKLGLERRVVYTRKVRDYQPTKLHPRTKCA